MDFATNFYIYLFFPLTLLFYWFIKKINRVKLTEVFLLIISLIFYTCLDRKLMAFIVIYLFILWLYYFLIHKFTYKLIYISGISVVIIILLLFKYLEFIVGQVGLEISIFAPLGISFITFSSLSYIVDSYHGLGNEGTFLDVAFYILFFPKVISGPIVLWCDFDIVCLEKKVDISEIDEAINSIILGLGKKVIIANSLALVVNDIWNNLANGADALSLWLCALAYMMVIYFDFSGYSDIAIGTAKFFGFSFDKNFDYPYRSKSISEFFRRWHISLGRWFREYIYIPLGGNRKGNVYINLFIVFLLTGIWHGANYTYVLWGVFLGLIVCVERFLNKHVEFYQKSNSIIKNFITLVVVYFSWIIFRAPSIDAFAQYLAGMFNFSAADNYNFTWEWYFGAKTIILLIIASIISLFGNKIYPLLEKHWMINHFYCYMVFIIVLIFMIGSQYSPFLYFAF